MAGILKTLQEMGCSQKLAGGPGTFRVILFCGANCAWPCPTPHSGVFFGHSRGCLLPGFVKNGNYVKK